MNLKQLVDRNLHQWPAKVICLLIATFLYVFHQVSLIDKKTYVVPLTIQENGSVMHVGTVPTSVSVIVRSSSENIKLISQNDISAKVNLDTITEKGVYELPVAVSIPDSIKALDPLEIRLKDAKVVIEADKKSFKYVNIEPSIVGDIAKGFEVESVSISPSTVKVTGPESILNSIDKVYTDRVNISNAEVSFSADVHIQNVNKLITIEEEEYKADVSVIPVYIEKEFTVPVDVMNLNPDLKGELDIGECTIKLLGTQNYLENYKVPRRSIQVYAGDIREPGTYELQLRFYFPTIVDILDKSVENVTLTVTENIKEEINESEKQ